MDLDVWVRQGSGAAANIGATQVNIIPSDYELRYAALHIGDSRMRFHTVEIYDDINKENGDEDPQYEVFYCDNDDPSRVISIFDGEPDDQNAAMVQENVVGSMPAFYLPRPGGSDDDIYYTHEDGGGQISYITDAGGYLIEWRFVDANGVRTYEKVSTATKAPPPNSQNARPDSKRRAPAPSGR